MAPEDFENDEIIGPIVQTAADQIARGASPPAIEGDYCTEVRLLGVNGEPASASPGQTRVRLSGQTDQGAIHYLETTPAIRAEADGFITGEGNAFTLWLLTEATVSAEARAAGLCDERDATIINGEVGADGEIAGEIRGVVLWEEGCYDVCPGLWVEIGLTMTLLGDCPSCEELDPVCSGPP